MKFPRPIYLLIFVFSCTNPDADAVRHDSIEAVKDSLREIAGRQDKDNRCCFQNTEECKPFFPDSISSFRLNSLELTRDCNNDTLSPNVLSAEYINNEGHMIAVRIYSYCAAPAMLSSEYSLMYEMRKGITEFNEFDVPPALHGFSYYNAKKSHAGVVLAVDDRFLVEILDQVCTNTKDVLSVYEAIPLEKLASFSK